MKHYEFPDGARMPGLGLGTWKSKPGVVGDAITTALQLGYRHIDCAAIYLNEAEIGQALHGALGDGAVTREQLWITSKLWNDAHAEADVRPALEQSLRDLQLDYLDLYLMHWPVALKKGVLSARAAEDFVSLKDIPLEATWRQLEACVEAGLCRHIGVSNFSRVKLERLIGSSAIKPVVNQVEMHPLLQQPALVEFCAANDVVTTAYSPLGSLDRPPSMKAADEPNMLEHPEIVRVAQNNNASPAQVLIAWALCRGTSVIPKSVNPERMKQNLRAAELQLSPADMDSINVLDRHFRYVNGSFWALEGSTYTVANLWDE